MPRRPISNSEKFEIVRLWLLGFTYEELSNKVGRSTSKISQVVREFKKLAEEKSLDEAARIYGVREDVEALRTIASKIRSEGMSLGDAVEGLRIKEKLIRAGINAQRIEES